MYLVWMLVHSLGMFGVQNVQNWKKGCVLVIFRAWSVHHWQTFDIFLKFGDYKGRDVADYFMLYCEVYHPMSWNLIKFDCHGFLLKVESTERSISHTDEIKQGFLTLWYSFIVSSKLLHIDQNFLLQMLVKLVGSIIT